jgi:nucleotide-binding universal stress UspA family protein
MEKKILIVVDGSIHSTHAVEYAVRLSSVVPELTYTLFHIQPTVSQFFLDEAKTDLEAKAQLKRVTRTNREAGRDLLEKHKARVVRLGISEDRISTDTRPKTLGVAKDILDQAEQGLYDAVLIGRRGLSRVQQTFMGSTAAHLVDHSAVIPVWVVDGQVTSDKLMIAVDGSEASFRAVDHVAFMLGGNEKVELTLFHVTPTLGDYCVVDFNETKEDAGDIVTRGAKQCLDHFYAQARKTLADAGFRDEQLKLKVVKRILDVGKAIADEVKKEDYGTLIVGRRGMNNAFFMGSVSRHVLHKASGRAVWVVS